VCLRLLLHLPFSTSQDQQFLVDEIAHLRRKIHKAETALAICLVEDTDVKVFQRQSTRERILQTPLPKQRSQRLWVASIIVHHLIWLPIP
jgi:hypothetical protein